MSTTDAVTARDSVQFTPRRARHFDFIPLLSNATPTIIKILTNRLTEAQAYDGSDC
jgi:hypothetical protein